MQLVASRKPGEANRHSFPATVESLAVAWRKPVVNKTIVNAVQSVSRIRDGWATGA